MLVIMLILSLLNNLFANQLLGSAYLTIFQILCGVSWLYMQATMLVHPLSWINAIMSGLATSYLWMGLSLAIAQMTGPHQDYSALLLLGSIVAGIAGGSVTYIRQYLISSMRLEEFSSTNVSVYDLYTWIREKLRRLARLEALADSTTAQAYAQAAALETNEGEAEKPSPSPSSQNPQNSQEDPRLDGSLPSGVAAAVDRVSRVRQVEERRLLREAFRGMHYLMSQFPQSELACLFASVGFRDHSPWLFHEAMALARAKTLAPSLDVLFHIYKRSG